MIYKSVYKCSFTKYPRLILNVLLNSRYVEKRSYFGNWVYYHKLTNKLYSFNVGEIGDCEVEWYE